MNNWNLGCTIFRLTHIAVAKGFQNNLLAVNCFDRRCYSFSMIGVCLSKWREINLLLPVATKRNDVLTVSCYIPAIRCSTGSVICIPFGQV